MTTSAKLALGAELPDYDGRLVSDLIAKFYPDPSDDRPLPGGRELNSSGSGASNSNLRRVWPVFLDSMRLSTEIGDALYLVLQPPVVLTGGIGHVEIKVEGETAIVRSFDRNAKLREVRLQNTVVRVGKEIRVIWAKEKA